jgi:hypothetical protein
MLNDDDLDGLSVFGTERVVTGPNGELYVQEPGGATIDELIEALRVQAERKPPLWSRYTAGERELQRDRRRYCGRTRPCPFPAYLSRSRRA